MGTGYRGRRSPHSIYDVPPDAAAGRLAVPGGVVFRPRSTLQNRRHPARRRYGWAAAGRLHAWSYARPSGILLAGAPGAIRRRHAGHLARIRARLAGLYAE